MRVYYGNTITGISGTDGGLIPLAAVDVSVFLPGTTTKATIYGSRNPSDLTPLLNPQRTPASGYVEFWIEPGDYDIFMHDTQGVPRIGDKTIGFAAIPGGDRGIPSTKVANDAGLGFGAFDAAAQRQAVPLGTVCDWWRPASSYDAGAGAGNPPAGWAVCNGQVIGVGSHDMGAGTLTLPDLRNKFIIGADILKVDGGASSGGDSTAAFDAQHPNAPGIRGVGGVNAPHTHAVPAHYHSKGNLGISDPTHAHTIYDPGHAHATHAGNIGLTGYGGSAFNAGGTGYSQATGIAAMAYGGFGTNAPGTGIGIYGAGTGITFVGSYAGNNAGSNGDAAFNVVTTDGRPSHYGLLKIMKVRRT